MTLGDYVTALRERWLIVVSALVLGVIGAVAAHMLLPAEYTARTSLFVSAQTGDAAQQAYQGAQLSEQRVKSYTELVTGDRVIGETLRRLDLPYSGERLAGAVSASTASGSVLIDIAVVDGSPTRAANVANTMAQITSEVVAELERPLQPGLPAPVAVRVVQPAAVPAAPSSFGLGTVLVVGVVVGLGVGVAGAVVRHRLDTTVKSGQELSAAVGSPLLGTIPAEAAVSGGRPLIVRDDPHGRPAEAIRQIRTNLRYIDVDRERKTILVTSPSSAEGKSTTVVNLAVALGSTGTKVLVIEADLRRPRVSALLALDGAAGLTQVVTGTVSFSQVVRTWGGGAFDVISSGPIPPNPSEILASNQMRAVIEEASRRYDLVLIDCPPLLPVTDAAALAPATDGIVLLARHGRTTIQQLDDATRSLHAVSAPILGVVLTMAPPKAAPGYATYQADAPGPTVSPNGSPPLPNVMSWDPQQTQRISAAGRDRGADGR